ncbi:hypothetical protein SYNPS1DRAFT_29009 [Syncephalis pseudoplumigaleata]|uniref:Uncharacterized protein n=1 Tax=Syncephalis pseudoplumigaleata TaxID=1712513 RepID=A0A4P9YYW3_9FUNG|nr:hypothetical protein SYNPS1DRAFT_29009 [Syncephalis pseudoplumigaleata]|eukprot:RKP25254.1 hypothetical protein SYNPS1DRAFT_29009 [Syncephalis pseudoplumigaleata]
MTTDSSSGQSQRGLPLLVADKAPPSLSVDRPQVAGLRSPARSIRHTDSDAGSIRSLSSETMYEFESVYENQRGMFVFGVPKFSAKIYVSPNLNSYQLPDPNWEWAHPEWTVDMSYDVDEEGWEYAFHFYNSYWHGAYDAMRSFVRRRRWVRLRRRRIVNDTSAHGHPARSRRPSAQPNTRVPLAGTADVDANQQQQLQQQQQQDWLATIRRMRIDREKLAYFDQWLQQQSSSADRPLTKEMLQQFLQSLDYHANRQRAVKLLRKYGHGTMLSMSVDAFIFYTDRMLVQETSTS